MEKKKTNKIYNQMYEKNLEDQTLFFQLFDPPPPPPYTRTTHIIP